MAFNKIILDCTLFANMSAGDIENILGCLNAKTRKYKKGEIIYRMNTAIKSVGIVLSGTAQILSYDFFGNQNIIKIAGSAEIFGEAYACQTTVPSLVDIIAVSDCEILFINVNHILSVCSSACLFHQRLIKNLLQTMAVRNIDLIKKIEQISPKSIRERVLAYLTFEAQKQNRFDFSIPFDRQQLADYLLVDRSALSKELSKMQKDGLIKYNKNHFIIRRKK